MRTDTLMLWLSASKPVAAVAIAQIWERGLLELDDRVAKHIPAFAQSGKDAITILHLLTHTAGFRAIAGDWEAQPWDEIIAALCAGASSPTGSPAARRAITRPRAGTSSRNLCVLDGRSYDQYVREMVFLPIGMIDSWIGMPPDHYRAYGNRIGLMHDTSSEKPVANYEHDAEHGAASIRPGSNGHGPTHELGSFYEMLLNRGRSLAPSRILSSQSVEALTARHRTGMYDHTFKHVMDWGLGFIINSSQYGAGDCALRIWETRIYARLRSQWRPIILRVRGSGIQPRCRVGVQRAPGGSAAPGSRAREINEAIYDDLNLAYS